jgi:hypothetical protein
MRCCGHALLAKCGILAILFSIPGCNQQNSPSPSVPAQKKSSTPSEYKLSAKDRLLNSVMSQTSLAGPQPPGSLPSDADPRLVIGVGYDSMSGEVRPACIMQTSANLPPPDTSGQSGQMLLNYVTSEDDIARSLGVDGKASFGNGVFSADASVSYLSSSKINRYSSYLLVTSNNQNSKQILTKYTLTQNAKAALKKGIPQFIQYCGDQFVRGRITGGSLSAIVSASSTTESDQLDTAATLHAAGWGGSIDASTQSKLQTYQSQGRLNMQVIRQGPAEAWPSSSITELIKYAQDFPQKVASGSTSAWTISYIVSTYDEVFQQWDAPASQVAFFNAEGPYLRALFENRNNYVYIQANPGQFGPTSDVKLTNAVNAANAEIARVKAAADRCLGDQKQCALLQQLALPDSAGRAAPWIPLDSTVNTYRNFFSVVGPDQKVVELKGLFYTQCGNHGAGTFGPSQWSVRIMSTKTGAVLYDGAYPNHPMVIPVDTQVDIHVIDAVPQDNCGVSGQEPAVRIFTPVFPDDYS